MPQYLVVHNISRYPQSQDEWVEEWRELRRRSEQSPGCTWLTLFAGSEERILYCKWEAENEDCIKACFTPEELEMAPILEFREIVIFDPAWLDDWSSDRLYSPISPNARGEIVACASTKVIV